MKYSILNEQLTGRNKDKRKLGNNTYAERRNGDAIAIRLHATDILTFYEDGESQYLDTISEMEEA